MAVFPFGQAGHDLVAGRGGRRSGGAGFRHVEIVLQAGVVGDDDEKAGGFLEGAHNVGVAALQDADDPPAGSLFLIAAAPAGEGWAVQPSHHQVAMKSGGGILRIDAQVGALAFRRSDKGKATGMKLDGAGDEIGRVRGNPAVVADAGDAAFLFEGGEGASDRGGGTAQPAGKGGDVEGRGLFSLKKSKDSVRQAAGGGHGT